MHLCVFELNFDPDNECYMIIQIKNVKTNQKPAGYPVLPEKGVYPVMDSRSLYEVLLEEN